VRVCIYIYIYIYICIYIYIYIYIHTHTQNFRFMNACGSPVHGSLAASSCACVCVCVVIHTMTSPHAYTYISTLPRVCSWLLCMESPTRHTYTYMYLIYTHTHIYHMRTHTSTLSSVCPWLLCMVIAHASFNGTCVRSHAPSMYTSFSNFSFFTKTERRRDSKYTCVQSKLAEYMCQNN
jgi:hypothetical protein